MFAFISPPPNHEFYLFGKEFFQGPFFLYMKKSSWNACLELRSFFPPPRMRDSSENHQDDMGIPNLHFPRVQARGGQPSQIQTRWNLYFSLENSHGSHNNPTWKGTSSEPIFLLVFQVNVHSCVLGFNMFIFQGVSPLSQFSLSKSSTLLARFDS